MTTIIDGEFPFDEIRKESGDFFSNTVMGQEITG